MLQQIELKVISIYKDSLSGYDSLRMKVLKHAEPSSVLKGSKYDLQRTICRTRKVFAGH